MRCLRKQTPLQGAWLDPHPEVPPGCVDGRRRSSLSWHTGLLPAKLFASVLMLCRLFPFFSLQLNNLGIEAFQHLIFKQTFYFSKKCSFNTRVLLLQTGGEVVYLGPS